MTFLRYLEYDLHKFSIWLYVIMAHSLSRKKLLIKVSDMVFKKVKYSFLKSSKDLAMFVHSNNVVTSVDKVTASIFALD